MSTPNDAPQERIATNDEWAGAETVGGIWDHSMFPCAPRDSRTYSPQDPLDVVPRKLHLFFTLQLFTDTPQSSGTFRQRGR
jgi:hypothetical protein